MTTPTETAAELRQQVQLHDHCYYNMQNPIIPDAEYDNLMEQLRRLEKEHPETSNPDSPTKRVGGTVGSSFAQVEHPEPMLSLASASSREEFAEWHLRTARHLGIGEFTMSVEPKIDGLAVRLVYRNGRLVQGVTRGNGTSGEDVTHNVRTVRNLPLTLRTAPGGNPPEILEVRGEIYMPRSVFEDANREREDQGEAPYSNPRNAASGILRQLDPELASRRGLRAWVYSNQHPQTNSHRMSLADIEELGLPVNPLSQLYWNTQEVEAFHREMLTLRGELDYEIDGIVAKVDHFSLRTTLGANNREPRWATAWKFPPGQNATMLQEIRISHGRFGRLTPVAVLEPVELGGVTVGSASLHNEDDVHRKDIRPETMVIVERAGDVIPQVTGPADPIANGKAAPFRMPNRCPSCGTRVETRQSEVGHWCPNQDCPALLPEQLKSFAGKRAMDIDGLGEHWCQELVDRGMVSNTADLFFLTREQLLKLDRMGEKLADRILRNIKASKAQPLERALYSLGIFRLGREVSTKLAARYRTMDEIREMGKEELAGIEGIGPGIAGSVFRGFRSERVQRTLELMRDAGVNMTKKIEAEGEKESMTNGNRNLEGKTLVVTGTLEGMTRQDAEALIFHHGGKSSSSVTRVTDYLVVGKKPGSKLAKAKQLGTEILDQNQFKALLEAEPEQA